MLSSRLIAALVAGLLVLGLAACGSNDEVGTAASSSGSSGSSESSGSSGGSDDAEDADSALLPLPEIDKSNGLTIAGEVVADKALYDAALEEGEMTLYSSATQETEDLSNARFTEETGIKVNFTRLPGSKLTERVLSEHGAGRLGAQVIRSSDPAAGAEFAAEGIFVPYETQAQDDLASAEGVLQAENRLLTPFYAAYVIAYNPELVTGDSIPTSWADLVSDEWAGGKLGMVNAGAGGTTTGLAHFHIEKFGVDYLKQMGALKPRIFDTTSVQLEAMARGEIAVGPVGATSGFSVQVTGAPIKISIPQDGVSGVPYSMGLTPAGEKSAAAKVFMNWTMSQSGQAFAAAQGYVPSRPGLPPQKTGDQQLPAADSSGFSVFTAEDAKNYAEKDIKTWNEAIGYLG